MLNLFNLKRPKRYTVFARYATGNWIKRFNVAGYSAYEAARRFDCDMTNVHWTRISGATLK